MRKMMTRLRGTNFCTSSPRFAPSFVRQPNGPKCTQIVRNAPNINLESNGVDQVRSLRKIPTRLRATNFCTSLARFAPSFVRQTKCPKCTQIVQNAPKYQIWVQWGGSDAFVAKNSEATSWNKLLHQFAPFCTEFCKATKRSQMHSNSTKCTKHQFRVQWGGSGAFVAKNSNPTSWHKLLH